MNKSVKLFSMAALLVSAPIAAMAQADVKPNAPGYVQSSFGVIVRGSEGLCWHTGYFTKDMAILECDPDLLPKPVAAVTPPPSPPPVVPPAPPKPPVVDNRKVTFSADAFFDFNKAVLKPEAKVKLDDMVSKLKGINLEVIIAVGHTDSIGSDAYNQKLSVQRAESVKGYLVSKGIEPNRIYTEGKGKKQPIAPNTINGKDNPDGRAKNRRVEIEVVGTRAAN